MPELNDPEIYLAVLEGLQTGVYIVDRNRRIRFWNDGAERITGYLRQDVVGRLLRDHFLTVGEEMRDLESDPEDPIGLAFRDGKPSIMEVSILHKDGYRIPVILRTNPIRNSQNLVIGASESFERDRAALGGTRRQSSMADFGCLDQATGVAARAYTETKIRENLITYAEHKIPFGILLVEVDRLDEQRANRGPAVIASILRVVAQSIENCVRPTDLVGRWDEHRFVAILLECRENEVTLVGERVRKMIARAEIEWWGDLFSVTSPLGGSCCREGDNMDQLVDRAAKSLEQSIANGGNCVTVLR